VAPLEIVHSVVLQRPNHIRDKPFRMQIAYARPRVPGDDEISHGVHEMRFTKSHATVDEKWIVGRARTPADL